MDKTGIIWTERTWNPVTGCKKVSAGCKYCYAETIANQYKGKAFPNGFNLTYREKKINEPLSWKTPQLVFVNSMSDLFWEEIPFSFVDKVLKIITSTPQHQYQVLTKRPERMLQYFTRKRIPENFWAGVTIENVKSIHRLDILKSVPASLKFISFEPLIESLPTLNLSGIDWVIAGGESGNHLWNAEICERRGLVVYDHDLKSFVPDPDKVKWISRIKDNCEDYGVKFFFKQWGGNYPEAAGRLLNGRTWSEFPRYPGDKTEIENDYLKHLESLITK